MNKTFAAALAASLTLTGVIAVPPMTEAAVANPSTEDESSKSTLSADAIKALVLAKLNERAEQKQPLKVAKVATFEAKSVVGEEQIVEEQVVDEEQVVEGVKPPTQEELDARTGLDSNRDNERRAALEKAFNIKLTEKMVWPDKKGQTTVDPDGVEYEYTSHDELKSLGIYAINANRQELIQYGIQTGDWYPYRAYEAQYTPGYFKVVDGKHEYTKVYYANFLQNYKSWLGETEAEFQQGKITKERYEELKEAYTRNFDEYLVAFKEAPGVVPYIIGVNNTEELAAQYGVEQSDFEFFEGVNTHEFMQGFITEEEIRAAKEAKEQAVQEQTTEQQ